MQIGGALNRIISVRATGQTHLARWLFTWIRAVQVSSGSGQVNFVVAWRRSVSFPGRDRSGGNCYRPGSIRGQGKNSGFSRISPRNSRISPNFWGKSRIFPKFPQNSQSLGKSQYPARNLYRSGQVTWWPEDFSSVSPIQCQSGRIIRPWSAVQVDQVRSIWPVARTLRISINLLLS